MFPFPNRSKDYPFDSEVSPSLSWPAFLFWAVFFFGPAAYFVNQGEYLLPVVLVAAGISAFSGYRMGALSIITGITALAAAIWFAPAIGVDHESQFQEWFGTTGLLNRGVSVAIVAVGISMLVWMMTYLSIGRLVRRRPRWDRMNRKTGFLIGMVQGVVGVVLLVGGLLYMEPMQRERLASQDIDVESAPVIVQMVFRATEKVDQSVIGPTIREHNPVEKIPQLNQIKQVQKTAAVLADPRQINRVMEHPRVIDLRDSAEVREAVTELKADEKLRSIFESGNPMDKETAMTLLSHPAVMNLVDQPGFLEKAKSAIDEIVKD